MPSFEAPFPPPPDEPSESDEPEETSRVTQLLLRWREGDEEALEEVTPLVYEELRRLARRFMRGEGSGHVLQTTALVHEAFLGLVGLELQWQDRVHFFSMASRLMRRVLVDFARRQRAEKRGGGVPVVELDESLVGALPDFDLLALDQALEQLAAIDERKPRVVEMRCFGGMTIDEVAEALDVSHATVERDLAFSRAWLARRLGSTAG
jgi:RNA polymerase sigma factor (TIGR02999 family)